MTSMTPGPDNPSANAPDQPLSRVRLNSARVCVGQAGLRLARWHRGGAEDKPGDVYVTAGHDAVAQIDQALQALHTARAALIGELRRDEDERAAYTDAQIAAWKAAESLPTVAERLAAVRERLDKFKDEATS